MATTPKPTKVQEQAIRVAIENDRTGNALVYPMRTMETMYRNGWIFDSNVTTYRITAKAAEALQLWTVAAEYRRADLIETDPKAQAQARAIEVAKDLGITAYAQAGVTETLTVSVEVLAGLLEAKRQLDAMNATTTAAA